MKEKIEKTLAKTLKNTQQENIQTISIEAKKTLGDPNCPICYGTGYFRLDLPVDHPDFGHITPCECRLREVAIQNRENLYRISQLDELKHLNFQTFSPAGKGNLTSAQADSLQNALMICENFANSPSGWLLIQGGYGCGKTHLAAAIANHAVEFGTETLFLTVPDLLDSLRFSFSSTETTFEEKFNQIRDVELLILDDFGTQNATAWAQEKLFQILNYRYINHLPLVITTNIPLDEIEGRIRSRLQDSELVNYMRIQAPDYRRLNAETSTPALSSLDLLQDLTFNKFESRNNEVGKSQTITEFEEITDEKTGEIKRIKTSVIRHVSKDDLENLAHVAKEAYEFARNPEGWLIILGPSGSGKTHLAAAIGNHRRAAGYPVTLVEVPELLDYLRAAFNPNSVVTLDKRFDEIKTIPTLILDGLGTHYSTPWAEEKLYQILNYRYMAKLPTVITSQLSLEELEQNHRTIANRILDADFCSIYAIEMPPYRRGGASKQSNPKIQSKKKNKF